MSILERDVILQGQEDGKPTIDFPITRLGNIEDGAKTKDTLEAGDMIPVIDSKSDGEMKKVPWNPEMFRGTPGKDGKDGKSAYQYAVDGGYTGTEAEFKALVTSGPWLPAVDGVIMRDVRIGGTGLTGKLIIDGPVVETPDGSSEQSAEPLVISSRVGIRTPIGSSVPYQLKWMTVDGPEIVISQDVTFNGYIWVGTGKAYIGKYKAATEKYVDDKVAAAAAAASNQIDIRSYTHTVSGPVSAGNEITFTITESPDKFPFSYTRFPDNYFVYFGKKLILKSDPFSLGGGCKLEQDYNFKLVSITTPNTFPEYNLSSDGTKSYSNMTFTVTCSCDKDIPSDTSVDILLAWVVGKKS